jgi:methylthioribulose-1-phosphate dehydratase
MVVMVWSGGPDDMATADLGLSAEDLLSVGADLARESSRFAGLGWMRGTSGNLSAVLRRDPLRLAVTASGLDKGELEPHHVVIVDHLVRAVDGTGSRPSAEARLHAHIAARSGAGAVIHVHHLGSVVAADRHPHGVEMHSLEMLKGIGRQAEDDLVRIPVIGNSQDMAVLAERFDAVYDEHVPAVVVARHGLYAWGTDLIQARHHTEVVTWLMDYLAASHHLLPGMKDLP